MSDRFHRIGKHLATDFANTRYSPDSAGGSLASAGDVLDFLVASQALTSDQATEARRELRSDTAANRFLRRAIALRGVAARLLEDIGLERPAAKADLATLNAVLKSDAGFVQVRRVARTTHALSYRRLRSGVEWVLAPIARALAELLVLERSAIRKCANPRCIRWFLDGSGTARRRWCEMAICGNRAKVAAFQRRERRRPTVHH